MSFEHPIVWTDENVSRLWDYYSRTPPYSDFYFSKMYGDRVLKKSVLPLGQPLNVLDFGCGPGFIWEHLCKLKSNWSYTGIDFSLESIEKILAKGNGKVNFRGAYHVKKLPTELPSEEYDLILLLEVVEHLKDDYLKSTLSEARRLLKPGGCLLITTPNEEDLLKATRFCPDCGALFHDWQHVRSWSVGGLENCLNQHSFVLQRVQTLDFTAIGLTRNLARLARKILRGNSGRPHMMAVFQKAPQSPL
jgi:SAM-dependent methyltransferase